MHWIMSEREEEENKSSIKSIHSNVKIIDFHLLDTHWAEADLLTFAALVPYFHAVYVRLHADSHLVRWSSWNFEFLVQTDSEASAELMVDWTRVCHWSQYDRSWSWRGNYRCSLSRASARFCRFPEIWGENKTQFSTINNIISRLFALTCWPFRFHRNSPVCRLPSSAWEFALLRPLCSRTPRILLPDLLSSWCFHQKMIPTKRVPTATVESEVNQRRKRISFTK